MEPTPIDKRGYYVIDFRMSNGFQYSVPTQGHFVISAMKAFMSLDWSESAVPRVLSKEEYDTLRYVEFEDEPVVKPIRRAKKVKVK